MKAIVVAMDKNRGIGANNDMPWRGKIPDEMAHFKRLTTGHSVIMGRKTFESIGRPLPNRKNIVVTTSSVKIIGTETAATLKAAIEIAGSNVFFCGGAKIYQESVSLCDKLYVTEIDAEFSEVTVFFPKIDRTVWKEAKREHHPKDSRNSYSFDFVTYVRH